MPNTLTGLFPSFYDALNVVSREMTGMILAVEKSSKSEMAAIGQAVTVPIVGPMVADDIMPSHITTTGRDRNIQNVQVVITKQKKTSFHLTGEDTMKLNSSGTLTDVTSQSVAQCFRTLVNEIEVDLSGLYYEASRAYGTPGTDPFNTADDLQGISRLAQILNINGAPAAGRSLILSDEHRATLEGKQPTIFKVNESGDYVGRRQGAMGMLFGFDLGHSVQMPTHGGNADFAAAINHGAGYGKGETTFVIDGVGGGETLKKGDLIEIAGAPGKYLVASPVAGSATGLTIADPGLTSGIVDNAAITDVSTSAWRPSIAMTRDAMVLACRHPALPEGGDIATDRMELTDPVSGLSFDIADYRQYRQASIEISIAWGVKTIKPAHMCLLVS